MHQRCQQSKVLLDKFYLSRSLEVLFHFTFHDGPKVFPLRDQLNNYTQQEIRNRERGGWRVVKKGSKKVKKMLNDLKGH